MGAAAAIGAAGIGMSVFSTYMSYKAAQAQGAVQANRYGFEAAIAERNALIARENAGLARERGMAQEAQIVAQTSRTIGSQRAGAAAAGIDVQSESALDVFSSTRLVGAQDVAANRYNTEMEARGLTQQASNFDTAATMARFSRAYAGSAATINEVSTLLAGGASILNTGYQAGMFPKFGKG